MPKKQPSNQNKVAAAIQHGQTLAQAAQFAQQVQVQQSQIYQGPIPPPDVLERFDALVPGTAAKLIQLAHDESEHRRSLEKSANDGNVASQARQLDIAESQIQSVFKSDSKGQILGAFVSVSAIVGAVFLSMNGHEIVAGALAALPTASVIQAFFAKRPIQK